MTEMLDYAQFESIHMRVGHFVYALQTHPENEQLLLLGWVRLEKTRSYLCWLQNKRAVEREVWKNEWQWGHEETTRACISASKQEVSLQSCVWWNPLTSAIYCKLRIRWLLSFPISVCYKSVQKTVKNILFPFHKWMLISL